MFLENGLNGFLPKPIEVPLLKEALLDWLPPEKVIKKSLAEELAPADKGKEEGNAEFWETLGKIEDINAELGLQRIGGLKKMYRGNLQLFTDKLAGDMEKMQAFVEGHDSSGFAIAVHALKSALASIGATGLSAMANELELAAKGGDAEYCSTEFPGFRQRLLSLHERLSAVFPPAEPAGQREKGETAYLMKTVQDALAAVDDFDTDAGLEALNELAGFDFGEEINGIIAEAVRALKNYDYDGARERLDGIEALGHDS
jgi:HPt (histidine-containing phosphotransfer) domain-containing protein